MPKLIITIDGPAGSGKSTIARMFAEKLGIAFLDTGAMYRAVTLAAINAGVNLEDDGELLRLIKKTSFDFQPCNDGMKVFVNNDDVTAKIRNAQVTQNTKYIASSALLRDELVKMQRQFASKYQAVVTEGRDQGTVAFADADFKFYLTADIEERAKRRLKELEHKGEMTLEEVKRQIYIRDENDKNRKAGPLRQADDAIEIDTTNMNQQQVVQKLLGYIKK